MAQEPEPPEYHTIPLPPSPSPDSHRSGTSPALRPEEPDSAEVRSGAASTAGGVRSSRRRRLRYWIRRHPIAGGLAILLLLTGLVLGGTGLSVFVDYHRKAKQYDLDAISRVEVGAKALDRHGQPIGRISLQDRRIVQLDQVPPYLIDALVATEDARYFDHGGYDLLGIARAALANLREGRIVQGGSTITQQLARHAYSLGGRNFDRKLKEFFLAQRIEEAYSKPEILEHYLNRIYFGRGFWGVGAAARGYFAKDVSDLTLPEAALLCAIIKSPNHYSPFTDQEAARTVRNRTLARMVEQGYLEKERLDALRETALGTVAEEDRDRRPSYLLSKVRAEALEILGRTRTLDGLEIRTTVDLGIQGRLTDALRRGLERIEARENYAHETPAEFRHRSRDHPEARPGYLQCAAVVLENRTGQIVGAVGGRNFRESQFNRVWNGSRPPGAAFFPFVYAAAFEDGMTPEAKVVDAPTDNRQVMIGGTEGVLGEWSAEDSDVSYLGQLTAGYGLAASKNGMTLKIGEEIGLDRVLGLARKAGITGELRQFPSTFLWASSVNLLELTHAYTLFPNLGWKSKRLRLISRISNRDGEVLYQVAEAGEIDRQWITSELTASRINQLLSTTFHEGGGNGFHTVVEGLDGGLAGKTGTAYEFTDNWFVGYNNHYTWGVWIGFDRPDTIHPRAFSKDTALPVWMSLAEALDAPGEFRMPPRSVRRPVCLVSGSPASDACRRAKNGIVADLPGGADFPEASAPGETCRFHERGVTTDTELTGRVPSKDSGLYRDVPVVEVQRPALTGTDPYGTVIDATGGSAR